MKSPTSSYICINFSLDVSNAKCDDPFSEEARSMQMNKQGMQYNPIAGGRKKKWWRKEKLDFPQGGVKKDHNSNGTVVRVNNKTYHVIHICGREVWFSWKKYLPIIWFGVMIIVLSIASIIGASMEELLILI